LPDVSTTQLQRREYSPAGFMVADSTFGEVALERELDIGRMVADVVAELEPFGARESVALRFERVRRARIAGSRRGLSHALGNVVRNAIEHSPHGRPVLVRVTAEGARAIVDVHDDGPGVSPPLHARVFEPFYSTRPGGGGLGLAVTAAVVHAHGGRIRFVAGDGCTVRIELPRVDCS
jgi:two-component system OmpR family sensor kinase